MHPATDLLLSVLPDSHADRLLELLAPREALSLELVAQRLSVSLRSVEGLIADGELRSFVVGRRRLVSVAALRDFVSLREATEGAL